MWRFVEKLAIWGEKWLFEPKFFSCEKIGFKKLAIRMLNLMSRIERNICIIYILYQNLGQIPTELLDCPVFVIPFPAFDLSYPAVLDCKIMLSQTRYRRKNGKIWSIFQTVKNDPLEVERVNLYLFRNRAYHFVEKKAFCSNLHFL